MNLDRINFSALQRASIDDEFLTTTLDMMQHFNYSYVPMGYRTSGPLGDELERIYARTLDFVHEAVIADREKEIKPVIERNLGRLSFINTLYLPSSKELHKKAPDEIRALGSWSDYQRLFVDMPNDD